MSTVTGKRGAGRRRRARRRRARLRGRHRSGGLRSRAAVAAVAMATWVVGRLGKVAVTGASMAPTLVAGDRLLVLERGGPWRRPRPGDIVTLADPRASERIVVKRFVRMTAEGVDVRGDAPGASTDSRTFGPVAFDDLLGRAVYRYAPPERAGRISG